MARPRAVDIDPRGAGSVIGVVEYRGRRAFAVATGTVDGARAVLLAGGTSGWVPEADVRFPATSPA